MAKSLHYRSERYEVQEFTERTISWKPIAHTEDASEALEIMRTRDTKNQSVQRRTLDRKHGAKAAIVVATLHT